jgi:ribosomal protein S18 acetylase RimI-like enzyme
MVRAMNEPTTIRAYQDGDREDCRSLWRELVEWHREIYADQSIGGEHPEDYFDKHLAKVGAGNIWVASNGTRLVGFVGLIVEGNEAEIEPLIVTRKLRHEGIGKQLVQKVISATRKRGLLSLSVRPVARNEEALKFFCEQGFSILGRLELFMDFSGHAWKSGVRIHGCEFEF